MLDFKGRSDAHAVRQVLAGRRDAFDALVTRYQSLVYHVALSHVGNSTDAEDIAQDAFLKAFRSLDSLQNPGRFNACGVWHSVLTHGDRAACWSVPAKSISPHLYDTSARVLRVRTRKDTPEPYEPSWTHNRLSAFLPMKLTTEFAKCCSMKRVSFELPYGGPFRPPYPI